MANTWYVKPLTAASGSDVVDGTSYVNAWRGLGPTDVVATVSSANDTFVCTTSNCNFETNGSPVFFTTTGTLPTTDPQITANTIYFSGYSAAKTFKIYTDVARTQLVDITDATYTGVLSVNIGPVWNSIQPGDTLYVCDTFGAYDEPASSNPFYNNMMLNIGTAGTDADNRVTIRGDLADHPGIIYGTNYKIHSAWTSTGTNGIYYKFTSSTTAVAWFAGTTKGNTISLLNKFPRLFAGATPTADELNTFQAGDWGSTSGGNLYVKPANGADANPATDTYMTLYRANSDTLGTIYITKDWVDVRNLTIYGGYIRINGSDNVRIYNNNISYSYYGVVIKNKSDNISIYGNTINHCADGIYLIAGTGGQSDSWNIYNNTISNIENFSSTSNDNHAIAEQDATNVDIYGNIVNNAATGVTFYADGSYTTSGRAYNNYISNIYHIRRIYNFRPTSADPCVITWASHPCVDGNTVTFSGITQTDWTALNGNTYYVTKNDTNTLTLYTDEARTTGLDTSLFATFLPNRDNGFILQILTDPSTGHGAGIDFHGGTSGLCSITAYNNIVNGSEGHGMKFIATVDGGTYKAYNNILYKCNTGILVTCKTGTGRLKSIYGTYKNNIISTLTNSGRGDALCYLYFYGQEDESYWGVECDYNDFDGCDSSDHFVFTNSVTAYPAAPNTTLTEWQALKSSAWDQSSIDDDPLFVNASESFNTATDFKPTPVTSPVIGAGTQVAATPQLDYEGKSMYDETGGITIGAYRGWSTGSIQLPGE